jgi:hypothetical protein
MLLEALIDKDKELAMTSSIILYDPTAPRAKAPAIVETAKPTLESLAGKVVGFIDNAKPNFNHLVDDIGEFLTKKYGVRQVLKRRKRAASVPAPDDVYQEYTEQCDLVITGSGD